MEVKKGNFPSLVRCSLQQKSAFVFQPVHQYIALSLNDAPEISVNYLKETMSR